MSTRARAIAFGVVALACAGSVTAVWRYQAIASTASRQSRAARLPPVAQSPLDEVPSAAPAPRDPMEAAVPSPALSNRSSGTGDDEEALMRLLRSVRDDDPSLAIELAREGNERFPGTADAAERASILVHALAEQGRASEARGLAEDMVNRYPDSAWVREVERFTGAHRHRNVRVGPDGELRYVRTEEPGSSARPEPR